TGPRFEVELLIGEVRRSQLVVVCGARRLVFARVHGHVEDGVAEAAVAGSIQARAEAEREDGAGRGAAEHELRRNLFRDRDVALTAVLERRQLQLDRVTELFP